ncbi:MAG: hypothetical protein M1817_004809 [Caeruleum heppii]|nr:MAG: hypothetical protein M1817_004809 [Caeruleum heppii]
MMLAQKHSPWPGRLRFVPLPVIGLVFLFSVTNLVFGIFYVKEISQAPRTDFEILSDAERPSVARLTFYAATMPFLSILHSIANGILYLLSLLSPTYSLISSVIFIVGWLVQWVLWMDCEISGLGAQNDQHVCFRTDYMWSREVFYVPDTGSPTVALGKMGAGLLVLVLYLTLLGCAAAAVHKNRMARKHGSKLENKGYESELTPVLR